MAEGFTVRLAAFTEATAAVDDAVRHFGGLADELEHNLGSLREHDALTGGFGVTGHFQNLLAEFGREWLRTMDGFVAEERAFVAFLQGFATRLRETHDEYRMTELRHASSFEDIVRSSDEGHR